MGNVMRRTGGALRHLAMAGLAAGLLLGGQRQAMAEAPSAGDLQWAQSILKEKGFNIGGRATGQMTPQTHAALAAYQKSVGLPATGALDSATVAKMMAERTAKTQAGVGNLAQQKPGHGMAREPRREVAPRAAQRSGPVANTGGGEVALGPVVRDMPPGVALPSGGGAGAEGPSPRAAPHAAVTATTADGRVVATDTLSKEPGGSQRAPGWLVYPVLAVLAGTLGFVAFGWWRSGKVPSLFDLPPGEGGDERIEPRFSGPRRGELRASLPPLGDHVAHGR